MTTTTTTTAARGRVEPFNPALAYRAPHGPQGEEPGRLRVFGATGGLAGRPVFDRPPAHATERRQNDLLAELSDVEWARWGQQMDLVDLPLGKVLHEPHRSLTHVYFPTTAIVSLLYETQDGDSAEVAVIGHEGHVGFPLLLGGESTPSLAVVQGAGQGFRLKASVLLANLEWTERLRGVLLRYTQAMFTQIAQTAVCNRHHSVDQQLCRWLLLRLDRSPCNELTATQELISRMLGVRREGVTGAAGHLHQAGLIRQRRGHIAVLDRAGLERRACECYGIVRREYDRLLAHKAPD